MFSRGSWRKTEAYLDYLFRLDISQILYRHGGRGVGALNAATPKYTGLASSSWEFKVTKIQELYKLEFFNTDIEGGASVVLLIQYGHGMPNGGYVQGQDFINPAIQPIFDQIEMDIWREVTAR